MNFCSENKKNQLENDNLKSEYKKQLKPDTYKYETSIEGKTTPLTNLYQKYKKKWGGDTYYFHRLLAKSAPWA